MPRPGLVLALIVFSLSTSAQAQIPNLRRKAKDAARQAVTGQQPQPHRPPPKFDNTMLELNPQVVARLITGLETRSKMRGTGSQTAAELRKRSSAASDEAANLNNQHSDDRAQWVNANGAAENCVSEQLNNAEQRHQQEMQQRFMGMTGVNTPAKMKLIQDWTAAGQEVQQAAMANDTAALRRAQEKMNKLMGVDAHADSAKALATCHAPAVPAWMRRADSLAAISDTLAVRARGVEGAGNAAAARAAEMTPEQFAMAAERAEGFVTLKAAGNVGSGWVFTPIEEQALTARLADLKKYFG
ncbi:MAG TPA: hypothetical protein VNJ06_06140 [Gemmatimonadales bacterium]|nr:hypothetical protein [Gemmatimonadales bacterium]